MLLGTVGLPRVRGCWKLLGYVAAVGNAGSLRKACWASLKQSPLFLGLLGVRWV